MSSPFLLNPPQFLHSNVNEDRKLVYQTTKRQFSLTAWFLYSRPMVSFCQVFEVFGTIAPMRGISPWVRPQHWKLRALLFAISDRVILRPTEFVGIEVLGDGTPGLSSL